MVELLLDIGSYLFVAAAFAFAGYNHRDFVLLKEKVQLIKRIVVLLENKEEIPDDVFDGLKKLITSKD